jgi:hypothetical protein
MAAGVGATPSQLQGLAIQLERMRQQRESQLVYRCTCLHCMLKVKRSKETLALVRQLPERVQHPIMVRRGSDEVFPDDS